MYMFYISCLFDETKRLVSVRIASIRTSRFRSSCKEELQEEDHIAHVLDVMLNVMNSQDVVDANVAGEMTRAMSR